MKIYKLKCNGILVTMLSICIIVVVLWNVKRTSEVLQHREIDYDVATETTKLYEETAKDGLMSKESLSKNHQYAKNNLTRRCSLWKEQTSKLVKNMKINNNPKFYLAAVLYVRIYEEDKAKLTTKELLQWIRFYLYIGVEHIYIYDSYVGEEERQMEKLEQYIRAGFVSYFDWHERNPYSMANQISAYQEVIDNYKQDTVWQMAFDMDEYPYSPLDKDPGFLTRYIRKSEQLNDNVSEITLQNYLVLGEPDLNKEWLVERLFRETKTEGNNLVKPIYIAEKVRANLHHNTLSSGRSINAPPNEIRFKHYWGARLQDWGPDTENILEITKPEYGILDISYVIRNCHVADLPHPY